jgi:hypothetical protein
VAYLTGREGGQTGGRPCQIYSLNFAPAPGELHDQGIQHVSTAEVTQRFQSVDTPALDTGCLPLRVTVATQGPTAYLTGVGVNGQRCLGGVTPSGPLLRPPHRRLPLPALHRRHQVRDSCMHCMYSTKPCTVRSSQGVCAVISDVYVARLPNSGGGHTRSKGDPEEEDEEAHPRGFRDPRGQLFWHMIRQARPDAFTEWCVW